MTASLMMSIIQLKQIIKNGEIHYWFGNWKPPYGIEFALDSLNGVIVVLICIMGLISTIYSMPFLTASAALRRPAIIRSCLCWSQAFLACRPLVTFFNLYVFLEITSLSGYTLIAMGGDKGALSAFRYLLIGTIGASFFIC